MKKLKKLVSILLAAVLVFGVAATGFAAAPETAVLEEVAADAAAAPEEEAPVVEEQPVVEVAAEEEAVADVAAAQTIKFTAKTQSASNGGVDFFAIPNASIKFTYSGTGDSIAVTSGTQTGTLTSTNPVTISLGETATADISFDVTNGSGIAGGTLTAELVSRSTETTGLIYDSGVKKTLTVTVGTGAITPTTEVILHNGDGTGSNTDGNDANIYNIGTVISGVVRASDGSVAANATVKMPYTDSSGAFKEETLTTDATGKYTFTTSGTKRVYFMAYDVVANKTINSKEYFGEQEFSIGLFDPATLVNVNVGDITLQQRNKVVVKGVDGAPIAGAKVYAHPVETPVTEFDPTTDVFAIADINGEASFPNLAYDSGTIESYTFYVLGGKLGTPRYFQTQTGEVDLTEIMKPDGSSTDTGYFYEQAIQMKSAPELAAVTIAGPGNVAGVKDGSVTLSATVGATGFPNLEDEDFKMEWQSKAKDATSWTPVADSNSSSLVLSGLTEAMNGTQYRLVAYPENAGFVATDVIGADKVVKVANCVSQPATLSVVAGNTVDGYVYSTSGGIVAGGNTSKLPVLNIWTAANFESNQKTVYTTATIQANGALAASYDSVGSKYLPITLPDGDYVIGIKPTTGKEYTTIYSGGSFANYYGGTAKFTVAGKSITGLSLNFDPTPAVVYTQQPASKTTVVGGKTTMTVAAFDCSGVYNASNPTKINAFQWKVIAGNNSPVNVGGATTATLTLDAVTAAMNGNKYFATATAGGKTVDSAQAVLTVGAATPVAIVKQPVSVSASVNRTAEFTVNIAGDATVTYEWQVDKGTGKFEKIDAGAVYGIDNFAADPVKGTLAGSTLKINANQIADAWNGYKYKAIVTAGSTNLTSDVATLSIVAPTPVTIGSQPVDTTAVLNRYAQFSVTAAGTAPYTFTWQVSTDNGINFKDIKTVTGFENVEIISNPNQPALSILNIPVTTANIKDARFRVLVAGSDIKTAGDNMVISNTVKVTDVSTTVVPASVKTQPADQTVAVGRTATFDVDVDGTGPFYYALQTYNDTSKVWSPTDAQLRTAKYDAKVNGENVWSDTSSFEVPVIDSNMNGNSYKIAIKDRVANNDGSSAPIIYSSAAKLTVTEVIKPTIAEQPLNQTIIIGGTTTFSVDVAGTGPFTYVWEKSADGKTWATVGGEAVYTTPPATEADDNTMYRVRVVNIEGDFVVSEPATLTVSSEITSASIVGEESLYIGDTAKFKIEVDPKGAYYDVEWFISDSNAKKASIDKDGVLTGKEQGILKVYAKVTSADMKTITVSKKISIKKAMTSFDLKSKENLVTLYKGGKGVTKYPWHTQLIPVNYKPSNASHSVKDLEWRTSDRFVATVENGKVKVASGAGARLGTVIITATDKGNDKAVATYILQVKKAK